MRLFLAMPRLRTIGRVHTALWAARAAWGQPHEYWEIQADRRPEEAGYDTVTRVYQIARERFLASSCDAMLTVEDDIVIPEHAIGRLVATQAEHAADVVYGVYCLRRLNAPLNAFTTVEETKGESITQHDKERARGLIRSGGVTPIAGAGLGCTLITRATMEAIPFRRDGRPCNDWYLAVDAQAQGRVSVADFGVTCGHMDIRAQRTLLWPDADAPGLCRREVI